MSCFDSRIGYTSYYMDHRLWFIVNALNSVITDRCANFNQWTIN